MRFYFLGEIDHGIIIDTYNIKCMQICQDDEDSFDIELYLENIPDKICSTGYTKNQIECFLKFIGCENLKENTESNIFDMHIDCLSQYFDINISDRINRCLKSEDIFYIGDLVKINEDVIKRMPNFGPKCLMNLKYAMEFNNITFGMDIGKWRRPDVKSD